jgi:pyridoxine 5-phosphate synthase
MPKLAVNIDHVATVRQARLTFEPDPVAAAQMVQRAGAQGLVMHLRQDRRHIQDRDFELIKQTIRIPLNMEMAASESMIQIALKLKPQTVTLVPELPGEITTGGGLDLARNFDLIEHAIQDLRLVIPEVSLFIDPDPQQIENASRCGADCVELHTGAYAGTVSTNEAIRELGRLTRAARSAHDLRLLVRAGHGLTYLNVRPVALIPFIAELSIGHSIISRSIFTGLSEAVALMLNLVTLAGE